MLRLRHVTYEIILFNDLSDIMDSRNESYLFDHTVPDDLLPKENEALLISEIPHSKTYHTPTGFLITSS